VRRALDSVLAQTYSNYSLYLIDDGSDDGTEAVLQAYVGRGRSVRQRHSGAAAARNRGIRISAAPYIAFLDADDFWMPTKLERQIEFLEKNPSVGLVCCGCERSGADRTGNRLFERAAPVRGRLFEQLVRECFIFTPTVLVRRRCIEDVGWFNESLVVSEDFNLWLRIAARWEIGIIPDVLTVSCSRPRSLSSSTDPEIVLSNGIAALRHVQVSCPELSSGERAALRRAIGERMYRYGSHLLLHGHRARSRGAFGASLRTWPANWKTFIKYGLSFFPDGLLRAVLEAPRKAATN